MLYFSAFLSAGETGSAGGVGKKSERLPQTERPEWPEAWVGYVWEREDGEVLRLYPGAMRPAGVVNPER